LQYAYYRALSAQENLMIQVRHHPTSDDHPPMIRLLKMNGSNWMALSVLLLPTLLLVVFAAEARVWTDTQGRTIEADIVRVDGSDAIVNRNGKESRLPLTLLSDADKQFVAKWQEEQKAAKASTAAAAASKDKPSARRHRHQPDPPRHDHADQQRGPP
jgi:hypothetical protein